MAPLTSYLATTSPITITTPIPSSTPRTALLRALQDPNVIIASQPHITDFRRIEADTVLPSYSGTVAEGFALDFGELDGGLFEGHGGSERREEGAEKRAEGGKGESETTYYHITEKLPHLPSFSFTAALRKRGDELDAIVHAPLGLVILSRYRIVDRSGGIFSAHPPGQEVEQGGKERGDEEMLVIEEEALLRGNCLFMPFVRGNFERAHQELHGKVIRVARGDEDGR